MFVKMILLKSAPYKRNMSLAFFLAAFLSGCATGGGEAGKIDPQKPGIRGLMGGAIQGTPLMLSAKVSTFAGSKRGGATDGVGTAASFVTPQGITTDGRYLYVADNDNHKIRKIEIESGVVSTLAGSGAEGDADGIGEAATFRSPSGITTDGKNLYVVDLDNHNVRKIEIASGTVTIVAGSETVGDVDGIGTDASFFTPDGITTDGINLYVADSNLSKIRKINIASHEVSTVAGSGISGSSDGIGTEATFGRPKGITTDGTNLYVSDSNNRIIRKIVIASGVVTTLAGSGQKGTGDGVGTAASFYYPRGVTTDGSNLYVADFTRSTRNIRKIVISTGVVTTLVGNDGYANVDRPHGITTDGHSLYVTDEAVGLIHKIQ